MRQDQQRQQPKEEDIHTMKYDSNHQHRLNLIHGGEFVRAARMQPVNYEITDHNVIN